MSILNKMFTVYTFMMDNEKKRVQEVEVEVVVEKEEEEEEEKDVVKEDEEEEERNTNSGQQKKINQSWNEEHKIDEIQSETNNVMCEHQRNIGEGGRSR